MHYCNIKHSKTSSNYSSSPHFFCLVCLAAGAFSAFFGSFFLTVFGALLASFFFASAAFCFLSLISLNADSLWAALTSGFSVLLFLISSSETPTTAFKTLTTLLFFFFAPSSVLIFLLCLLQAVAQVIFYDFTFLRKKALIFLDKKTEILPSLATKREPLPG